MKITSIYKNVCGGKAYIAHISSNLADIALVNEYQDLKHIFEKLLRRNEAAHMEVKAVKDSLNTHVKLAGSDADYLFTGYIFRKGKKGFIHQAELLDVKNGNSITIAKLEDVEEMDRT